MNRRIGLTVLGVVIVGALAYSFVGSLRQESNLATLRSIEARVAELESDLQQVADHRAIVDNELQYTRGLDRHDDELINNSFWPDARVSYGTLIDTDELARWANEAHAEYAAHQHHVTGLSTDIDGETAHDEGYILYSSDLERDTSLDAEGVPTPGRVVDGSFATLGSGRYVNRYEHRNGEWRMVVHEYVHDIGMRLEAVDICALGCLGRWDESDISYERPLEPLSLEERRARAERGMTPRADVSPSQQAPESEAAAAAE